MLKQLASVIQSAGQHIRLTILEIGALQIESQGEPFYSLLHLFPGSTIIGLETDPDLCDEMNRTAKNGVRYYPVALGERNEQRKFYITRHPMCCSLYQPNEALNGLYNNLEAAYLEKQTTINTISLDFFSQEYEIGAVDFIKIDIQGAELDVFKGGPIVLKDVLAIVCEVEFIPHYIDQPLFGDVCTYLDQHNLMFHKFIGFGGRALKPIVINNNPNAPTQIIWSDAMFVRHVNLMSRLSDEQLLKLSILAAVYNSPDLSFYCLAFYDERKNTSLSTNFLLAMDVSANNE